MAQLTKMQQKIYDYIVQAIQDQGYPPSVREIGEAVGLKSPSTVHFHLKHLEELGVIGKQAGKGRALTLTEAPQENQVPIVGNVAAGSPILAQECIEDYLTFDTGGRDGEYFALRVRGESMINAGILPLTFADPADYDALAQGAHLRIDNIRAGMAAGALTLTDTATGKAYPVVCSLTERQQAILLAGGLLNYTKEHAL